MKPIDMTPFRPYRETGASCDLREIRDKKVIWPLIDHVDSAYPNFRLRIIALEDVNAVADLWRNAYPDVYGSVHEWILHPDEYQERVAFVDNWETDCRTMPHTVMVGEDQESGRIVMNNGEKYATGPEEWDLLPEIRELWEYLENINAHSSEEGLKNP